MALKKITTSELDSRGATTLPDQPQISATALKEEFDAPAKQVVAPKFNMLVDDLVASTGASNIGAVAPTGRTGENVQDLINNISSSLGNAEDLAHTHLNKEVLDKFSESGGDPYYNGNPIGGGGSGNTFKTIKVGTTNIVASGDDTLELRAGSNVTLTPDASNKVVTINSAGGGGQSTGDMLASEYDSDYSVKSAGGIADYVASQIPTYTAGANITISAQNEISATDTKYTAGNNVSISEQNVISAEGGISSAILEFTGTASNTGIRKQVLTVNGSSTYEVSGSAFMETAKTLSTTNDNVYTFTNAAITSSSVIDVFASIYGFVPTSVVASSGVCTVTFPKYTVAQAMTCRIYIK